MKNLSTSETMSTEIEMNNKMMELLNHPMKWLKHGGSIGLKAIKSFVNSVLLFVLVNFILLIYSFLQLLNQEFTFIHLSLFIVSILVSLAFIFFSIWKSYQTLKMELVRELYNSLSSIFRKTVDSVLLKVKTEMQKKGGVKISKLSTSVNIDQIIEDSTKKLPTIIRKGISSIASRLPILDTISSYKDEVLVSDFSELSEKVYRKMDKYIVDFIFSKNTKSWIYWILPLNVLCLILLSN